LRAIGISKRRVQVRAEHLEIHSRTERLELIAKIAQPFQPIINIEKSRLPAHRIISDPIRQDGIRNDSNWRGF
jgi:hypothetical protein